MSWSIAQVARASGVTARTLRYYDEIGLLRPAYTGSNGYRYYEPEQLLRLQRILLLRELDMSLVAIATVLDGEQDPLDALRAHRRRLLADRDRLDTLLQTVTATIAHFEKGTPMPAEEMFAGFRFNPETIEQLQAKAGESDQRYFEELKAHTAGWSDEQFRQVEHEGATIERRLLALLRDGAPADDPAVFDVLDDDVTNQRRLMELNAHEYAKLGQAFAASPDLRAHLDAQDPRLADHLRDAMVAYASARMWHRGPAPKPGRHGGGRHAAAARSS